jgi:hypothetical protein
MANSQPANHRPAKFIKQRNLPIGVNASAFAVDASPGALDTEHAFVNALADNLTASDVAEALDFSIGRRLGRRSQFTCAAKVPELPY